MKKSATEKKKISSKILIIDHVLLTTLVYVMLEECHAPSCKRMECFDYLWNIAVLLIAFL